LSLTVYPFNLRGQVYGSPMPFGLYDHGGTLLQELKAANVTAVVLLAEIEECREKTGRDLLALYEEEGLRVLSLPTPNYGIPSNGQLADVLKQARGRASDGHNVLIHCSAGLGRTALFAALLAKDVLGLSGREAIEWLGRHKPDALLTPAQIMMLMAYSG
jgi:protein-tyrosine phosphatase